MAKRTLAIVAGVILALVLFLFLVYGGFFLGKDLDRRGADADRKIFENSTSYIQGKAQEISKARLELEGEKDPVARTALRRHIIGIADSVDTTKFTPEMQTFIRDLRNQQ